MCYHHDTAAFLAYHPCSIICELIAFVELRQSFTEALCFQNYEANRPGGERIAPKVQKV